MAIGLLEKIAARPPQKFIRLPAIKPVGQQQPPILVDRPLVLKDKGLMDTLRSEYRQKLDGVEAKWTLFKRNSPTTFFEGYALEKYRVAGADIFQFTVASSSGQEAFLPSVSLVNASSMACRRRLRISIKEMPSSRSRSMRA